MASLQFSMEMKELFEVPSGRSETIPNQGLKISDLMNRSARLQNFPIFPDMEGDDEEHGSGELDDIEDKFEMMDRLSYYERRVLEYKQAKEAEEAEKARMAHDADEADKGAVQ